MDDKTALHTAARRYCQERFSDWIHRSQLLQAAEGWRVYHRYKPGWDYSDEAYRTFPRYRIDKAIEVEVERLTPGSIGNLEELRALLVHACDVAEIRLHAELENSIARETLRDEADGCRAYLQVLGVTDLAYIEPLPFRRVIHEEESKRLQNQLKLLWGIEGGDWFPLQESPPPPNVMAFHGDYFERMEGKKLLREALKNRGISRIFQLHEFEHEPDYEIELSIFEPSYGSGGQQYSASEPADWVVYASHESSITLCGDWLTEILKEKWPECNERTYRGPYSTENLRGTWDTT